jgi:transposase-like protein
MEQSVRRSAKQLIEEALRAEVDLVVDAEPHERTRLRKGSRNGYHMRQLITQYGILNLRMPRIRGRKIHFETILRYRRYSGEIEELIRGLFFGRVSTRKVGVVLEYLLDTRVSPQTVSRITQKLEREVIDYLKAKSESEAVWEGFLEDLYRFVT